MSTLERGNITSAFYQEAFLLDPFIADERYKAEKRAEYEKIRQEIKLKPLVWNVYTENFNERRIEIDNIFDHSGFYDDCVKAAKKYKEKDTFAEEVRRSLMYYFWSKCEWEIVLTAWPPRDDFNDEKIDVYDQVRLNWDAFIDYLWDNRGALYGKRNN